MITLFNENTYYRACIEQAHRATVFLRKPETHTEIRGICPGNEAIHWIYDYPLVRFLCNSYEQATDFLAGEELELFPQIKLLISLLEKIFDTMRVYKIDNAPFACVVPEIADLSSYLEWHACCPGCADAKDIYVDVIAIVRCKCLSTVNSIFHFAYVLTQTGQILAREALL
jgi:hypothetical protein